jgi:hypothetical protein
MSQVKTFSWTNPNPAVARNLDVGFTVAEITVTDGTNGGQFYWNSSMPTASVIDVDAGTYTSTNGVTPLSQGAMFGAAMSNFTSANPGVITASNVSTFGFAAGDTIEVSAVAESGSSTSKNGTFTVASVTATSITLVESTAGYNTYVSGGYVSRISDSNGDPIPTENFAIRGVTLGTSAVGANSAVMTAVARSAENVT